MKPVFLRVQPRAGAKANGCVEAVNAAINDFGGQIVYGWQIWQTEIITEAEFHAVWRATDGTVLDVTPKAIPGIGHILFAEDPTIRYIGRQIENVRINNTGNALLDDMIQINEARFRMMNAGGRADETRVVLQGEEKEIYAYLGIIQINIETYIKEGGSTATECYCGSGGRYYECHGDDLKATLLQLKGILARIQ